MPNSIQKVQYQSSAAHPADSQEHAESPCAAPLEQSTQVTKQLDATLNRLAAPDDPPLLEPPATRPPTTQASNGGSKASGFKGRGGKRSLLSEAKRPHLLGPGGSDAQLGRDSLLGRRTPEPRRLNQVTPLPPGDDER